LGIRTSKIATSGRVSAANLEAYSSLAAIATIRRLDSDS
jgi:hypothetical protein